MLVMFSSVCVSDKVSYVVCAGPELAVWPRMSFNWVFCHYLCHAGIIVVPIMPWFMECSVVKCMLSKHFTIWETPQSPKFNSLLKKITSTCLCRCVHGHGPRYLRLDGDRAQLVGDSSLLPHESKNQSQVLRLGSRCLNLMSHFPGPNLSSLFSLCIRAALDLSCLQRWKSASGMGQTGSMNSYDWLMALICF